MSKSVSFIFNPPDMILSFGKETGISKGGGYYPGFKEIICYKNNNGAEEIIIKKFKDLEEKEYILPQFNKTPEGRLYFTTWSGSSEKNSYFHDNGEWVRSEMFLPGKQLEEENRDIVPDDLGRAAKSSEEMGFFELLRHIRKIRLRQPSYRMTQKGPNLLNFVPVTGGQDKGIRKAHAPSCILWLF